MSHAAEITVMLSAAFEEAYVELVPHGTRRINRRVCKLRTGRRERCAISAPYGSSEITRR